MDLDKLEAMQVAAALALPVMHDGMGSINSKDDKFTLYDEGGANADQTDYVIALVNTAPELFSLIRKQEAELNAVHRKLAAETLRADQGWTRYEEANRDRNALRLAAPQQHAQAAIPDQTGDIFDLIREWAHLPEGERGDAARKIMGHINQSYMAGVKDTRFLVAAEKGGMQEAQCPECNGRGFTYWGEGTPGNGFDVAPEPPEQECCQGCGGNGKELAVDSRVTGNAQAALSDEPSELEAVIACLGDDAARLEDAEPEVADNMRAAERLLESLVAQVQQEREACAAIADSVNNHDNPMTSRDVADSIRARSASQQPAAAPIPCKLGGGCSCITEEGGISESCKYYAAPAIQQEGAALELALDSAYPIPSSPHASVQQRAYNDRCAFENGWQAHAELVGEPVVQEGAALDERLSFYDVALTDEDIVKALHSLAIDTFPSKFGFPETQVSGTNVPGIRRIVARCTRIIAEKCPAAPLQPQPAALADAAQGERFFFDHGMLHDRVTGQHMWTQDQYDEHYRDGLAVGRENAEIAALQVPADATITEAQLAALLPGTYYMDPPDGGSVTVLEQLQRMAVDASYLRWMCERGAHIAHSMDGEVCNVWLPAERDGTEERPAEGWPQKVYGNWRQAIAAAIRALAAKPAEDV